MVIYRLEWNPAASEVLQFSLRYLLFKRIIECLKVARIVASEKLKKPKKIKQKVATTANSNAPKPINIGKNKSPK